MKFDEKQLLREPDVQPNDVLKEVLDENYGIYLDFCGRLNNLAIVTEWRYYNDGKAWLAKNIYKKKTVFWLSVWEGCFRISLFFTDKTVGGVLALPISEIFKKTEPSTGKLIPILIKIDKNTDLDEIFKIIEYKRKLL